MQLAPEAKLGLHGRSPRPRRGSGLRRARQQADGPSINYGAPGEIGQLTFGMGNFTCCNSPGERKCLHTLRHRPLSASASRADNYDHHSERLMRVNRIQRKKLAGSLAAISALVVLVAACGGAAQTDDPAPSPATVSLSTNGASSNSSSSANSSTTTAQDIGSSVEEYCSTFYLEGESFRARYRDVDARTNPAGAVIALIAAPQEVALFFGKLEKVAPPEIQPDISALQKTMQSTSDNLPNAATDPVGAMLAALITGATTAGSEARVNEYTLKNCGPPPGSTTSTGANASLDVAPKPGQEVIVVLVPAGLGRVAQIVVYDAKDGSQLTQWTWDAYLPSSFSSEGATLDITWADCNRHRCADIFSPHFSSILGTAVGPDTNEVAVSVDLTDPSFPITLLSPLERETGFASNPYTNHIAFERFLPDGRVIYVDQEPSTEISPGVWGSKSKVKIGDEVVLATEPSQTVTGIEVARDGDWAIRLSTVDGTDEKASVFLGSTGSETQIDKYDIDEYGYRKGGLEDPYIFLEDLDSRLPATRYDTGGHGTPVYYNGTWAFLATAPTATEPTLFTLAEGASDPDELSTNVASGNLLFYGPWAPG